MVRSLLSNREEKFGVLKLLMDALCEDVSGFADPLAARSRSCPAVTVLALAIDHEFSEGSVAVKCSH